MLRIFPGVPILGLILGLSLLVGIPGRSAEATQLRIPDIEALSRHADLIVIATVLEAEAAWRDDRIETRTTLVPRAVLHGDAPSTLAVRTPGGRIGDIATRVHGTERLSPGGTYLLFLQPVREDRMWQSVALAWGVYEVDPEGSEASGGGEASVRRQGGGGAADDARLLLSALEARVAQALANRFAPGPDPSDDAAEPTPPASAPELRPREEHEEGGGRLRPTDRIRPAGLPEVSP